MTHVLSVAEKPSVAKALAQILGGDNVRGRQGFSVYNRIFDIPNCDFKNGRCSMTITSVTGHLMEKEFDSNYKSWSSCAPVDLFHAPIKSEVKKENKDIEKTLIAEAKKCNTLLLWLDGDLEGENICYEVIAVCIKANPRMDVYRARFSALIERDIYRTLRNPERPNQNMSDAVDARAEIDLRIGAAFTRFQTKRIQDKFSKATSQVVSYGPCQFPTLGFVVERHQKIQAFVASDFWSISCEYEETDMDGKLFCYFNWDRTRLFDRLACTLLFESCIVGDGMATVTRCHARPTTRQRPCPLNTIELQKKASVYLRMGSDRTMQVAEALYQRGILSYPRTETDFFKEGFDLTILVEEHRSHSIWGAFASDLLDNNKFTWPRNGGHDDQAHPPIHPTRKVELAELTDPDEKKIYELVSIHFLACCAQDARGDQTTIGIEIPQGGESFSATGLMIIDRAWLAVYNKYEKWSAKKVPVFQIGDTFPAKKLQMTAGHTTPPSALSESDLISEMDRNGIGTDATIANHIKTIQTREYAVKNGAGNFIPTDLGLALVEGYNSMGLKLNKPYLRAAMEADCQKIVRGETNKITVVAACLKEMELRFRQAQEQASKLDVAVAKYFGGVGDGDISTYNIIRTNFSTCGTCNGKMDIRSENENNDDEATMFLYCMSCKKGMKLPRGELQPFDGRCAICNFQVLTVSKEGKSHHVCPYCFKIPPGAPHSLDGFSDFRCFACAHETCVLSGRNVGSDIDVAQCTQPNCFQQGGTLRVAKGSIEKGGFKVACSRKECARPIWWIPAMIKSCIPNKDEDCVSCSQRIGYSLKKLQLTFNLSKAPRGIPGERLACPSCDSIWEDINHQKMRVEPLNGYMGGGLGRGGPGFGPGGGGPGRGAGGTGVEGNGLAGRGERDGGRGRGRGRGIGGQDSGQQTLAWPVGNAPVGALPFVPVPVPAVIETSDYNAATTGVNVKKAKKGAPAAAKPWAGKGGKGLHNDVTDENAPNCVCGGRAASRTTTKDGPNKGRVFYACPKAREEQCKFFVWADEHSNEPRGGGGGGGRGGGGKGNGITCSKCKQEGHYSRECPNQN